MKGLAANLRSRPMTSAISIVVLIVVGPLLGIAALLSIPVTCILRLLDQLREAKLKRNLSRTARLMPWPEARQRIQSNGTFIQEFVTVKVPSRLWWTPEDIETISPHACCFNEHQWMADDCAAFCNWCYHRYTHPSSGTAFMVVWEKSDGAEVWPLLEQLREQKRCVAFSSYGSNKSAANPAAA